MAVAGGGISGFKVENGFWIENLKTFRTNEILEVQLSMIDSSFMGKIGKNHEKI